MTMMKAPPRQLDLRGLKCPLPALRTRRLLSGLSRGDRLEVLADDPLARVDIAHLCNEDGHRLSATIPLGEDASEGWRFAIEAFEGTDLDDGGSRSRLRGRH